MYRAPSEQAAAEEAYRRACVALDSFRQRLPRLGQANRALIRRDEQPFVISEYIPPEAPPVERPDVSLADYIRQVEDVTGYYVEEAARLDAQLEQLPHARADARALTTLGAAPRGVPFPHLVAEFTRGFWLALRFVLLFPRCAVALCALGYVHVALIALPLAGVTVYAFGRFARRARYLSRGEVPTIVARAVQNTSVNNSGVPRLHANGWDVALKLFSGYSIETELTYRTSQGLLDSPLRRRRRRPRRGGEREPSKGFLELDDALAELALLAPPCS